MCNLGKYLRAGLTGVLFAIAGFSYALATYDSAPPALRTPGAAGRSIFGTLRFTNPLIGDTDRDLGDAIAGSVMTSRFALAIGGVPPLRFSSTNLATVMSSLTLQSSGLLTGSIAATAKTPIRFDVTVTDSFGTLGKNVTENFRITLVKEPVFAFAIDSLPDGSAGRSYMARLITINGAQPIFSAKNPTPFNLA